MKTLLRTSGGVLQRDLQSLLPGIRFEPKIFYS
jgi:hypothetical protein